MTERIRPFATLRQLADIGRAAMVARYRLTSPQGALFLLAAVFDPYIYAVTVYFVLTTVFKLQGGERFHILLIGFIAFRWGVTSLVASANLRGILARMAEHSQVPLCAAVTAVVTPPSCVFLLSLASAYVLPAVIGLPQQSLDAIGWLPFVVAIQAVWTVALILVLAYIRGRRWLSSDRPVIVIASLMWVLSPVMYTFGDIPEGASKLLTSYNPVSHLLAAYQNTYWYGRDISLEVLPWVTVLGVILIFLLSRFAFADLRASESGGAAPAAGGGRLLLRHVPAGTAGAGRLPGGEIGTRRYVPWRARFDDLRGRDLVRMIAANWGLPPAEREDRVLAIRQLSAIDRLFDDYLAIYPDQALDQLAFAVALRSPPAAITLDGILDTLPPAYLASAWEIMAQAAARGRRVDIVCYQPILPPDTVSGRFEIHGPQGPATAGAAGAIGPELATAYEALTAPAPEPAAALGPRNDAQESLAFPTVLVTGASSQIGQCVIRRLCADRVPVVAMGRRRPETAMDAHLRFVEGDLSRPDPPFPATLSAVVHIAAIWLLPDHLDALHARGVRRIVCFSSTSIFVKHDSSNAGERDLVARMKTAEAMLAERCDALGIAWTVLRPTLVYGLGIDRNVSRAAKLIRGLGVYPLSARATGLRQPVHADDLAGAALRALATPAAAGKIYDVGGGEALSYREMIGRIFDALGKKRRFLTLPGLEAIAAAAGIVLRRPEVTGAMVRRMGQDLICDNSAAARDLGFKPRNFLTGGRADLGLGGIDSARPS